MSSLGDENVVLDSDSTNIPVLVQDVLVDELAMRGVLEIRIDDELAKVDLTMLVIMPTPLLKNLHQAQL
jgi:hypothetical protein